MTLLLEIKDVNLNGLNKNRLSRINISIHTGEKIALLGRSGAGKTTLLSLINGTIKPDSGLIKLNGKPIDRFKPKDRERISTLWQDLRLIDELNVCQNIQTGTLAKRNILWAIINLLVSIESKEVLSSIKATGLPNEILHRPIAKLSGGQKQRVAIARLIVQKSELLLADEPLSNLDPNLSNRILDLLIKKTTPRYINVPNTSLISIHNPELISHFTRVICLRQGEIVFDSTTEKISPEDIEWIYSTS